MTPSHAEIAEAFSVLDLPLTANEQEIKQAYQDLIQVWHPDRHQHKPRLVQRAEEQTKRLNSARSIAISFAAIKRSGTSPSASGGAKNPSSPTSAAPPKQRTASGQHRSQTKQSSQTSASGGGAKIHQTAGQSFWKAGAVMCIMVALIFFRDLLPPPETHSSAVGKYVSDTASSQPAVETSKTPPHESLDVENIFLSDVDAKQKGWQKYTIPETDAFVSAPVPLVLQKKDKADDSILLEGIIGDKKFIRVSYFWGERDKKSPLTPGQLADGLAHAAMETAEFIFERRDLLHWNDRLYEAYDVCGVFANLYHFVRVIVSPDYGVAILLLTTPEKDDGVLFSIFANSFGGAMTKTRGPSGSRRVKNHEKSSLLKGFSKLPVE